ncbi:MAG: hypothetical protein M9945_14425 [Aquamicrobium sp.]|uniref:hypothetical protein n=1 Tax=Aquamicrobium sp. TaxID=1872579 RepID=UPI00349EB42D|nr:hypothetical protein [Aquamicrobium sp.]
MKTLKLDMAVQARIAEIDKELEDLQNGAFSPHDPKLDARIDELTRERWRLDPESAFDTLGLR